MHREVNFSLSRFILISGSVKQNVKNNLPSHSSCQNSHPPVLLPHHHSHLKNKCNKKENKTNSFLTNLENESFESKTIP